MPYEKVLVTHKFGIISQSHKKELLERLKDRREKLEKDSARRSAKTNDDMLVFALLFSMIFHDFLMFKML